MFSGNFTTSPQHFTTSPQHFTGQVNVFDQTIDSLEILDTIKMFDYMKAVVQSREDRFQELKKQFVDAVAVIRSFGGNVSTDNPYLKNLM